MRLFVFGCGYSATAFVERLDPSAVAGVTTRSPGKAAAFATRGLSAFVFSGTEPGAGIETALAETTHLLVSIAPGADGDPALRQYQETILKRMPKLAWIGYLSTVGVYGDHDGGWVDEETPVRPVSQRSVERVAAEEAWTQVAAARSVPLAVLRLSGIYGPDRNALVNLREGKARRLVKPGQVFNRIHVDDIAGALILLAGSNTAGIFNVTDDEPAPPQDVVEYAAKLARFPVPPAIDFDTAALSPMARSFYGENKRVSNAKLKRTGYTFSFPTYREALAYIIGDRAR
ncbi:NAD(P)-dependent oxidoreductase [Aureimonas sp. SA4125]|uniref:SDR family oxidoreductase n=1 Tax=Aureimonas sp. SA4125 TaxID=2826993 RepID=UPI001CC648F8|nr:SDR family oxidoreductase [Aureimonas sp. SA4125]BDA86906.1 NAD(P)-dependent oxidoreductase [Aureimonas sp. SA4125]